ncbi:MAG: helix-turn-helix transcriptional regulator, partial [Desulfobacterales bacterium]
ESKVTNKQSIYIDIIESNIKNATQPIISGMSNIFLRLTPTEIKVANLLKQDKVTKDIASLMGLSPRTIEAYRSSIRRKFDIKKRNINLKTFLLSKH